MTTLLPSIGRSVWYFGKLRESQGTKASGPYAALVCDVGPGPDVCTLRVTGHDGADYVRANVPYDEKMGSGTWCWPTRI
jgi:hypothetical protein